MGLPTGPNGEPIVATKELVTKVWIEEGCIVCDACETACPEVFEVTEDTCLIRPAALEVEFTKSLTESINDAAEECPVDVIKFDVIAVDAPDAEAAPAASAATAAADAPVEAAATPAAEKPAAEKKPAVPVPALPEGPGDPALQALLAAATASGGKLGVTQAGTMAGASIKKLRSQSPDDLPPDARFARVLQAAKGTGAVSRRGFLSAAGIGWLAFGASSALGALGFQRFMFPNVLEEPSPYYRVGPLELYAEMPPNDVNEDFKGEGIWIIRTEDSVAALSTTCTHLGCIPNWLPNERKFKCPCHGSGFKPSGINFEGPAPRPLERYKVFVEDGIVNVDKSRKFQQEKGEWDNPDSFVPV